MEKVTIFIFLSLITMNVFAHAEDGHTFIRQSSVFNGPEYVFSSSIDDLIQQFYQLRHGGLGDCKHEAEPKEDWKLILSYGKEEYADTYELEILSLSYRQTDSNGDRLTYPDGVSCDDGTFAFYYSCPEGDSLIHDNESVQKDHLCGITEPEPEPKSDPPGLNPKIRPLNCE